MVSTPVRAGPVPGGRCPGAVGRSGPGAVVSQAVSFPAEGEEEIEVQAADLIQAPCGGATVPPRGRGTR